jgi:hypothetical protein
MNSGSTRRHYQAAIIGGAGERGETAFDIADVQRVDRAQLHTERLRDSLDSSELSDPGAARRVPDHRGLCHARRDFCGAAQRAR